MAIPDSPGKGGSPLLLLSLALLAGEVGAQRAVVRPGVARSGSTPGTEEWVAILRGRSFSLTARFAAIRAEPDRQRRRVLIDAIERDSRREHQAFVDHVQQLGGRVLRHHWLFHACTIEIARDRLVALGQHPSAAVLCPNEERRPSASGGTIGLVAAPPIGTSRNSDNHNFVGAHARERA